MPHQRFHPAVEQWFGDTFAAPTACQRQAWPAIQQGRHTLIAAPTGSGKTLAAFLAMIDRLVRDGLREPLGETTRIVYVSPLKALSNDIHKNLDHPLCGIREVLKSTGIVDVGIRTMVRTGDTPSAARAAMQRHPPHILVTTPESLYILLTSEGGRRTLKTVDTVIIDEIHALAGSKRGSHLSLSVERLEALTPNKLLRVGLSATQRPIEKVARYLVGAADDEQPDCVIIDAGHVRPRDLAIELPLSPLECVMSADVWKEVYDRLATLIEEHETTLVFVNTRRLAERVARHLSERLGEQHVTSHHGSMAKEKRLDAEQRLKAGKLRALVATASLELGIDIGNIDLVCQLGSTHAIATFLQRVGRSGHSVGAIPKGRLFPLSRDELVECTALLNAALSGDLDRLQIPEFPLDVLAQQVVAAVACEQWHVDALYQLVCRAYGYRHLPRREFDQVIAMLADGFATRRGRRGAYLHFDAVNEMLRPRKSARLTAITNGGAIPDNADYDVVLEPAGTFVGTLNEDFAIESLPGDIFQLGNASWQILRIEAGKVRVADARGQPPTIPFWFGEAPGRSDELSTQVADLRASVARALDASGFGDQERRGVANELSARIGLSETAAGQLVDYLASAYGALGALPDNDTVVMERFFDESGGMQLVIHSTFGSRVNRAWGLALRKRFCRKFNFELQAAASEDAIVLSLGETQSFSLPEVANYLNASSVREILIQALLVAPIFTVRWRWNANISLAVPRFQGGKKVPPQLQRMRAEDLVAVVFPDQIACPENLDGPREAPDHPLVNQTLRDGLVEAMDIDGLERLLRRIEDGQLRVITRDLTEPSPLAQEILSAKPYAFLDDAPLEERRTRAVISRRWLDPESAADIGRLDRAAIARVRDEAWPLVRDRDELHDALSILGFIPAPGMETASPASDTGSVKEWQAWFDALCDEGRASLLETPCGKRFWVAVERISELRAVHPDGNWQPVVRIPDALQRDWEAPAALTELVRGRLSGLGPVDESGLAGELGVSPTAVAAALLTLESEGYALRGNFTGQPGTQEWCERRLLARIHRYTVNRLRKEIEPVSVVDFVRYLLYWQHVEEQQRMQGPTGLAGVVEQLSGFEAPAGAWEADILPARISDYEPDMLDQLCTSGQFTWLRLSRPARQSDRDRSSGPIRTTPIALVPRTELSLWRNASRNAGDELALSHPAALVVDALQEAGASFFAELVAGTGLLRTQVEDALAELVGAGMVSADSFSGLRALLVPSNKRHRFGQPRRRRRAPQLDIENAGRWSLNARVASVDAAPHDEVVELVGRRLLMRYGIVFKQLLERETMMPPWRELLRFYRRLEARGELRGGGFVAGLSGEQFALPEALSTLRRVRKQGATTTLTALSASDPLNLLGILTPDRKLAALTGNRLLYRDGLPIAVYAGKDVRFLEAVDEQSAWDTKNALLRRRIPPALRNYLGRLQ